MKHNPCFEVTEKYGWKDKTDKKHSETNRNCKIKGTQMVEIINAIHVQRKEIYV